MGLQNKIFCKFFNSVNSDSETSIIHKQNLHKSKKYSELPVWFPKSPHF